MKVKEVPKAKVQTNVPAALFERMKARSKQTGIKLEKLWEDAARQYLEACAK